MLTTFKTSHETTWSNMINDIERRSTDEPKK